jgi:hypothetical protein
MKTHPFRILTVTVKVPFDFAYEFARHAENFPKWAAKLATLTLTEEGWVAGTPGAEAIVRFAPENEYGVLDHSMKLQGKPEVYIPLRMVQNGHGTQVELMLFRLDQWSDDDFERETALFKEDLHSLKMLLEASAALPKRTRALLTDDAT